MGRASKQSLGGRPSVGARGGAHRGLKDGNREGLSVGTYRALIVGAGGMGRAWGQNLRDCAQVEVVSWVDLRPEAAAHGA